MQKVLKTTEKNTIKMCVKDVENVIAKGTSKIGGFPDLPPEIPYPTMSGYSCKRGDDTERYEKSAMRLVAQINLADIADLDIENKLPHTGILYFFLERRKSTQFTRPTNGLKALLTTPKIRLITR